MSKMQPELQNHPFSDYFSKFYFYHSKIKSELKIENLNESNIKLDRGVNNILNTNEILGDELESIKNASSTPSKKTFKTQLHDSSMHLVCQGAMALGNLKERTQQITDLIFKDSSIFVRKLISTLLLAFSFLFCVLTLGSELGEQCLAYIFSKIEVTNYYDSTRHIQKFRIVLVVFTKIEFFFHLIFIY